MLILSPLIALIVIGYIYREDLGARALAAYGMAWSLGLVAVLGFDVSPGFFVVLQCLLAVAMLIHVRANPEV